MNGLKFRPFQHEDKDRCIEIFMSNTPRYFGVEETEEFRQFLETLPCAYFVATQKNKVLACGGRALPATKSISSRKLRIGCAIRSRGSGCVTSGSVMVLLSGGR